VPETYPRKLKRVVIREEYVALTGTYVRAILLHQLEYRQKCAFDVDRYLAEEGERLSQEGIEANLLPANGWFYKKAAELADETMLGLDETTIRRHLKSFIRRGWVNERRNPKKKWDRTMQYRLDLVKIKRELEALGYQLEEWVFKNPVSPMDSTSGNLQLRSCKMQDGSGDLQLRSCVLQEQYQNTSYKHQPEHTHNTAAAGVGVSRSKFSQEEIARYVEDCAARGQQIQGGLAIWLQETGKGDSLIASFQESKKVADARAGDQKIRHTHVCPRCFGTQMEVVTGKGARPCTYADSGTESSENTVELQNQYDEALNAMKDKNRQIRPQSHQ